MGPKSYYDADYRPLGTRRSLVTKKKWRKPELKRLSAGSAENSTNNGNDGIGPPSNS